MVLRTLLLIGMFCLPHQAVQPEHKKCVCTWWVVRLGALPMQAPIRGRLRRSSCCANESDHSFQASLKSGRLTQPCIGASLAKDANSTERPQASATLSRINHEQGRKKISASRSADPRRCSCELPCTQFAAFLPTGNLRLSRPNTSYGHCTP